MILIVDDDPSVTASLGLLLKQHGHACATASTPGEALALVAAQKFDLVLQDMNFSLGTTGEEGLDLLSRILEARPGLPVILMTAWGSIPLAVKGMKAGARDFVAKPWSNAQIVQAVETALSLARDAVPAPGTMSGTEEWGVAAGEAAQLGREELDARFDLGGLVGRDPRFLQLLALVGRVGATDASVLITGESGTGKELIAEALHRCSRRRHSRFVKVNLGGISSTLFESEMFGHVRGAFTDAKRDRRGRFEAADGGTIFLDEIGELDPSSQVKLLRVLQDRTYEVLGSSVTRTVDVRVVSATNRPLQELVARGAFREDLFYRINLISLKLPALRGRPGDIAILARHFLKQAEATFGRAAPVLTPRGADWLAAQRWPGNVRQLKQTMERAMVVLEGDSLDAEHLRALAAIETEAAPREALPTPGAMTLDQIERAMIVRCLGHFEGNITRAAEALGLSRAALYRRLEKHGLDLPHT